MSKVAPSRQDACGKLSRGKMEPKSVMLIGIGAVAPFNSLGVTGRCSHCWRDMVISG